MEQQLILERYVLVQQHLLHFQMIWNIDFLMGSLELAKVTNNHRHLILSATDRQKQPSIFGDVVVELWRLEPNCRSLLYSASLFYLRGIIALSWVMTRIPNHCHRQLTALEDVFFP